MQNQTPQGYYDTTPNSLLMLRVKDSEEYKTAKKWATVLNGKTGESQGIRLCEILTNYKTQSYSSIEEAELKDFMNKTGIVVKTASSWMMIILRDFFSQLKREELKTLQQALLVMDVPHKDRLIAFLGTI